MAGKERKANTQETSVIPSDISQLIVEAERIQKVEMSQRDRLLLALMKKLVPIYKFLQQEVKSNEGFRVLDKYSKEKTHSERITIVNKSSLGLGIVGVVQRMDGMTNTLNFEYDSNDPEWFTNIMAECVDSSNDPEIDNAKRSFSLNCSPGHIKIYSTSIWSHEASIAWRPEEFEEI